MKNIVFLIVAVVLVAGCKEVTKEELVALNQPNKNIKVKKDTVKIDSHGNVVKVKEKKIDKKERHKKIVQPVFQDTNLTNHQKYTVELLKIKREKEKILAQSNLELSLAKLEKSQQLALKEKELQMKMLTSNSKIKVAKLELQKVQEVEKTEQLKANHQHVESIIKEKNSKELGFKKLEIDNKKLKYYGLAFAIFVLLIMLYFIVNYFLKKREQEIKVKLHEDELNYKLHMKMIEEQSKNLDKMLDLVTKNELDQGVKKELLQTIKDTQKKKYIFEQKPKRSLIFRS